MFGSSETQIYLKTIWLSSFQLSVSIRVPLKIIKFWFVSPQVWVWFHLHPFWIQMFFYQTDLTVSNGMNESSQRVKKTWFQNSWDTVWDWTDLWKEYFLSWVNSQFHFCGLWYIGRTWKSSRKRLMIDYKQ